MADFKAAKVVAALPATLEADTVYFIRAGSGFDIKVTNGTGIIVALDLNQLVASAFGKLLMAADSAAAARGSLGLGTAATRDVGTGSGNVMQVGAFGIGGTPSVQADPDNHFPSGVYTIGREPASVDGGIIPGWATFLNIMRGVLNTDGEQLFIRGDSLQFRTRSSSGVGPLRTAFHTGNIQSTTGQSTQYPMTQKAVTNAINARGFADASGILTATSGALSNDMSSFLSQTTKATMRSNLGVPQLNATATRQGGLKARLDGTTLYLTNNGTNP